MGERMTALRILGKIAIISFQLIQLLILFFMSLLVW
jgi:hypothetical protein